MTKIWTSLWDGYKNLPSEKILNEPAGMSQRSEFVGMLLKYFDLKGKTILEVGTGTGQYSIELAKRQAICTGIDIEQESIDLATRIGKDVGSSATFLKQNLFDVTDHYDIVFSMGTIEHFTEEEIIAMFIKMSEIADYVVVGVPYSGSHAYMLSKEMSMQLGTWEYGVENDFETLWDLFIESGMYFHTETTIGAISEAAYLKRLNPALIQDQMAINLDKMQNGDKYGSWLISIGQHAPGSYLESNIPETFLPIVDMNVVDRLFTDGALNLYRDMASCPDGTGLLLYRAKKDGSIVSENVIISKEKNPTNIIPVFYTYYREEV